MINLLTVVAKVFSNTLILLLQNVSSFCNGSVKAIHIFSVKKKKINVFAIFQDENFKIMLANNFVNPCPAE